MEKVPLLLETGLRGASERLTKTKIFFHKEYLLSIDTVEQKPGDLLIFIPTQRSCNFINFYIIESQFIHKFCANQINIKY